MKRTVNQLFSKLFQLRWVKQFWADHYRSINYNHTPWTPLKGALSEKRLSMVTTAGVHCLSNTPFDMSDKDGDPSLRIFSSTINPRQLGITHDYYDHSHADQDINIVVPFKALRSCVEKGLIGSLSPQFYGFMGHIRRQHIQTLLKHSCRELIRQLKRDDVEIVLLAPA